MALRDESDLLRRIIVDAIDRELRLTYGTPVPGKRDSYDIARRTASAIFDEIKRNDIQIVVASWPSGDE